MIPLKDFVRMEAGSTYTYILPPGHTLQDFLKRLSTYVARVRAKIAHESYLCINLKDNSVIHMVICKVAKSGVKRRRQPRGAVQTPRSAKRSSVSKISTRKKSK